MSTVANTAAYDDSGLGRSAISAGPEDFLALLKPRVMSLVVFTALVGMVLAPGTIHPVIGLVALVAIAVGAGASGALNMWYDADIDRVMGRTASRPVPSGRVSPEGALQFGGVLSVMSVMVLGVAVNWAAAAFLAFTIFFYVVIYTMWLKRWTPQNIVIGGAAGAFPPMIGWTAVTGVPSLESAALFLIIFLWTPPHFWALAILKRDDYARAGVPMLPVVAGEAATRRQIFVYTLLLVASSFLPLAMGFAGWIYGAVAALLAAGFLRAAWRLVRVGEGPEARTAAVKVFLFSITYLFVLFGALLAEQILRYFTGMGG